MKRLFRNFLLSCFVLALVSSAQAKRLVFSNEQAQTLSTGAFVIDSQNYEDEIQLKFGASIDASVIFDRLQNRFVINRNVNFSGNEIQNFQIESLSAAPTCDATQSGRIYFDSVQNSSYTCNGQNWRQIDNIPGGGAAFTPYVSPNVVSVKTSETKDLVIDGNFFTPTSVLTIPSFPGTINSVSVLSPMQINVNVTAGTTVQSYDVVVNNNGLLNTVWSGNGVGKISVLVPNDGSTSALAATSCKKILDDGSSSGDGMYWIDPNGGATTDAFQVYCDMTTDGGGWTRVSYASDLAHQAHFTGGDANRWLTTNFSLALTDAQINSIRSVSTTAKQKYVGSCQGVIHHLYQTNNYAYAFGFRFHDGHQTAFNQQTYPSTNITVSNDGCKANTNTLTSTTFDIVDLRLPVINVHSRDNSSTEQFGAKLTENHVWFR